MGADDTCRNCPLDRSVHTGLGVDHPFAEAETRVDITMTLHIDVEAWCLEYGTSPAEVAGDVEEHVTNSVVEHLRDLGVLA